MPVQQACTGTPRDSGASVFCAGAEAGPRRSRTLAPLCAWCKTGQHSTRRNAARSSDVKDSIAPVGKDVGRGAIGRCSECQVKNDMRDEDWTGERAAEGQVAGRKPTEARTVA